MSLRPGVAVWGVGLIGVGLLLLAANLGWLAVDSLPLLPLLVILFGVWLTVDAGRRPGRRGTTAGVVVIAAGAFWLAVSVGWLDEEMFLAVLLIALGLGVLLRGASPARA